jgi:hypothetical protein
MTPPNLVGCTVVGIAVPGQFRGNTYSWPEGWRVVPTDDDDPTIGRLRRTPIRDAPGEAARPSSS